MSLGLLRRHASACVAGVKNYLVVAFVNDGTDVYTCRLAGRVWGEVTSVFCLLSQEFLQSPQGTHSLQTAVLRLSLWQATEVIPLFSFAWVVNWAMWNPVTSAEHPNFSKKPRVVARGDRACPVCGRPRVQSPSPVWKESLSYHQCAYKDCGWWMSMSEK